MIYFPHFGGKSSSLKSNFLSTCDLFSTLLGLTQYDLHYPKLFSLVLNPGPHSVQTPRNSIILNLCDLSRSSLFSSLKKERLYPGETYDMEDFKDYRGPSHMPQPYYPSGHQPYHPYSHGPSREVLVSIEMFSKWAILNSPIFNHTYNFDKL